MRISDWSSDVCSSDLFLDQSAFFKKLVSDVLRLEIVNPARVEIPCNMPVRCKTIIHFPVKFFPVCRIINQEVVQYGQAPLGGFPRSEEHTSELQSLMRTSYAVFCLKKKTKNQQ